MVTDRMIEDGKESHCMSLTVPARLIEQAEAGEMRLDYFLQCIKARIELSLLLFWERISQVATTGVPNMYPSSNTAQLGLLFILPKFRPN